MYKRTKIFLTSFIAASLIFSSVISTNSYANTLRIVGNDTYETSLKIAQSSWEKSDYVFIVSENNSTDALCTVPLAKSLNSPILLTSSYKISENVLNEIKRLGASHVVLIGGTGVISQNVEDQIKKLNTNIIVERLAGKNRYETSVKIAEKLGTVSKLAIISGESFSDALSIAAIAAEERMPLLLIEKDNIPSAVKNYISNKNFSTTYIIGGEGVISKNTEQNFPNVKRLCGNNRYETNKTVINEFLPELNLNNIYVADGELNFIDAFSGSALAAKTSSPLVLTSNKIDKSTKDILQNFKESNLIVLGSKSVVNFTQDNTTQYRGDQFNRGAYNTFGPLNSSIVAKYTLDGYKIYTQPAVAKDKSIFFVAYKINLETGLGDSYLVALNGDLTEKWKLHFNAYAFSSPTLNKSEDRVYIGLPSETDGDDGKLLAIDTKSGSIKWTVEKGYITASPTLDAEGNLIVGEGTNLTKISPKGEILWSYALRDGVSAKPAIDDMGNIYLSNHDKYIYCINKDGKLIWEKNIALDMSASTVIDEKGNLYVGGYNNFSKTNKESKFIKLNSKGDIIWECSLGKNALPSSASLDVQNKRIYFLTSTVGRGITPDSSFVWCLNYDGTILWKNKVGNLNVQASPCIDSDGNVYIGFEKKYEKDKNGIMGCFDKNGKTLFEYNSTGDIISPATLSDNSLYFGDVLGNFYKIK